MGIPTKEAARQAPGVMWGTPDQLRTEIGERVDRFNITHFPLYFGSPGGVELFAREVLPAFSA